MNDNQFSKNDSDNGSTENSKIFLGVLYAVTLIYFYQNISIINESVVARIFGGGVLSFILKNLIPILAVILLGRMFNKMMSTIPWKRMVKIFITWLSAIFIYSILYQFYLSKVLIEFLNELPVHFGKVGDFDRRFLRIYIEPLFYPLTMGIVIYLVFITMQTKQNKEA